MASTPPALAAAAPPSPGAQEIPPARPPLPEAHMIVCGDDGLAERLSRELGQVYRQQVVLVREQPDDRILHGAGVSRATALALVYDDDETNIHAALRVRRLNPRLRLVIRLYNRKLGTYLEDLLDRAVASAAPEIDRSELDASTTVLSDADTAAPALAAAAVAGTSKVIQADGLLLRAAERAPGAAAAAQDSRRPSSARRRTPLCTLALLSATASDPAGAEGSDTSGAEAPALLPDDEAVAAEGARRGTVVLETVSYDGRQPRQRVPRSFTGVVLPLATLFSARLRWSFTGLMAAIAGIAFAAWQTTGTDPLDAAYVSLLDVFAIGDPAYDEADERKILQILAGLVGLLLLPVLVAAILEGLGAFRSASALRRPPRGLAGHVVLVGLGKIGTRVLRRLRELRIPVVCIEENPQARGVPLARRLRVPTLIGDATDDEVLTAAKAHRAHALLALTSDDSTNLEATLCARSLDPALRVVLRVYEDEFADAVYRTLRDSHPGALTRSRSVTTLAAPAFAGAMMGRQILGAIPVERRVLLFAVVEVAGHPQLEGRTVAETFAPGARRVLALQLADDGDAGQDAGARDLAKRDGDGPTLVWDLHPGYVLQAEDRVVLATTREGLAELLS